MGKKWQKSLTCLLEPMFHNTFIIHFLTHLHVLFWRHVNVRMCLLCYFLHHCLLQPHKLKITYNGRGPSPTSIIFNCLAVSKLAVVMMLQACIWSQPIRPLAWTPAMLTDISVFLTLPRQLGHNCFLTEPI